MRRALPFACLSLLLVAACGGDSFETQNGGAGGSDAAGAAGSGTAGSGTAGSGTSGSGTAGSETAGSATAGSGTAGSGTSGSGTAGSGTSGSGTAGSGTAGSATAGSGTAGSGTSGSGTAGSGTAGSAGGACNCPAPADLCAIADCNTPGCPAIPNPKPPSFPQIPHDCRAKKCSGVMTVNAPDPTDVPAPLGPCDVPACTPDGSPTHTDDAGLCAPTDFCMAGACKCKDCPNGTVAGLPAGSCKLPGGTKAEAPTLANPGEAPKAVDGSASTEWNSGIFLAGGGTSNLTATLPDPVPMRKIVVNVDANNATGSTSQMTITVEYADDANNISQLTPATKLIPDGGDVVVFPLSKPTMVKWIKVTLTSKDTQLAIFEIAYQLCAG